MKLRRLAKRNPITGNKMTQSIDIIKPSAHEKDNKGDIESGATTTRQEKRISENAETELSSSRIVEEIGGFGLYQILVGLSTGIALALTSFTTLNFIFAASIPDHRYKFHICIKAALKSLKSLPSDVVGRIVGVGFLSVTLFSRIHSMRSGPSMQFLIWIMFQMPAHVISIFHYLVVAKAMKKHATTETLINR